MRLLLNIAALLIPCSLLGQGRLTIEVSLSKPEAGGVLRLAVCPDEASYTSERGCRTAEAKASGPAVRVELTGMPEGTYALKAFHDVNNDGALNTNWMGIPKEPYGFGNDAMGSFGPPDFRAASFTVAGDHTVIRIRMKG